MSTSSRMCGMPMNRSISQVRALSAQRPSSAALTPAASATTALTAAVTTPMRMLRERPLRVRVNISRPIQSVPNRYSAQGARFLRVKSVARACSRQAMPTIMIASRIAAARISRSNAAVRGWRRLFNNCFMPGPPPFGCGDPPDRTGSPPRSLHQRPWRCRSP